jgi:hypothetical protein
MASRIPHFAIASLIVGILAASPAQADPIRITSGQATLPWDDASSFSLEAEGFELKSAFFQASVWPLVTCGPGCAPGTSADLSAVFGGEPTHDLGWSDFAAVNGVTYEPPPALRLFGDFWFDAGVVTVPPMTFETVFPSTTFVFHGRVAGFLYQGWDQPLGSTPAFDVALTGRGTASMRLIPDLESGLWRYPEVYFRFEDQAPIIPEPASVLLVSGGLAALLVRRRSARRRD